MSEFSPINPINLDPSPGDPVTDEDRVFINAIRAAGRKYGVALVDRDGEPTIVVRDEWVRQCLVGERWAFLLGTIGALGGSAHIECVDVDRFDDTTGGVS